MRVKAHCGCGWEEIGDDATPEKTPAKVFEDARAHNTTTFNAKLLKRRQIKKGHIVEISGEIRTP